MKIASKRINEDEEVGDLLKLVLIPNHKVSHFEAVLPGAELLQHISTPGTESAGNSNLKFMLNGGRFLTSQDGVNLDILKELKGEEKKFHYQQEQGDDNLMVSFGITDVEARRYEQELVDDMRSGQEAMGPSLRKVFMAIKRKEFGEECMPYIIPIMLDLADRSDYAAVIQDFTPYVKAQKKIDEQYKDQYEWNKSALVGVARSGKFAADAMVDEYREKIWDI